MPLIKDNKIGDYIVITGRAGIEYFDPQGNKYFIDSELVDSSDYDIAIYPESLVQIKNNNITIEVNYKKIISRTYREFV